MQMAQRFALGLKVALRARVGGRPWASAAAVLCLLGSAIVSYSAFQPSKRPIGLIPTSPVWKGGTVDAGTALTHVFKLTNTSNELITIEGFLKSCGCTSVTPSTLSVPPGQDVDIRCVVDTSGLRSSVATSFVVQYKSAESAGLRTSPKCVISAGIKNAVVVSPDHLRFDSSKASGAILNVVGPKGPCIESVVADDLSVSTAIEDSGRVSVTFNPEKWSAGFHGRVSVIIRTTCQSEPRIVVPVDVK
jgi:hypothetical protein